MAPRPFVQSRAFPPRAVRALTAGIVALLLLGPVGVAAADDHLGQPDGFSGSHVETGPLIAGVLGELGLDADDVARLTGEVRQGVNALVEVMIEEGILTTEQVASLEETVAHGDFHEQLPPRVRDSRARRDAFRSAAREVLSELGIEVPDGVPLHDVLVANGIDPAEFAGMLDAADIDLPPPPPPPGHPPPAHHDPVPHPVEILPDEPTPTPSVPPATTLAPVDGATTDDSVPPPETGTSLAPPDTDTSLPPPPDPSTQPADDTDPAPTDSVPDSMLGTTDEEPVLTDLDQAPTR